MDPGSSQTAQPSPVPLRAGNGLPLLWFEEIVPVLDVSDFVQGLLTAGSAIVVYGASNSGKTFWATDLALHVAAGLPWNGRRITQGGVIYCVLEGGFGFRNRVAAWKEEYGVGDDKLPFAVVPAQLNLLQPEADTGPLIDAIRSASERMAQAVTLVVIDTLARAMAGGNENAPDDMGQLVANMDRIRAETGAAVMFIHHTGKTKPGALAGILRCKRRSTLRSRSCIPQRRTYGPRRL